tara:strand:+ start:3385 stop:3852 length:468 start_codon:yes stop_codon:yes gene_type:complete
MSKDINQWIDSYGESHQNPINKMIHWFCVPLIMFSLLGLLSIITIYDEYYVRLNVSHLLIVFAIIFYFRLSFLITIGMFLISSIQLVIIYYFETLLPLQTLLYIYLIVFVIAWIGQFIGHKIEGEKPSFFEDIQFLLIGPAWLLSFIYKKLKIKY